MKKLAKETAFAILGIGTALTPAMVIAEDHRDASSVRIEIAKGMLYSAQSKGASGYKWTEYRPDARHSNTLAATQPVLKGESGFKWDRAELHTGGAEGQDPSAVAATEAGYKWGIRSNADQAGYKWGIRSDADQAGYKWGIRSNADQAGYKWGIRSDADQAGYKWGIR